MMSCSPSYTGMPWNEDLAVRFSDYVLFVLLKTKVFFKVRIRKIHVAQDKSNTVLSGMGENGPKCPSYSQSQFFLAPVRKEFIQV